jgi:small nuclear ribonucleoprotein (snRNP)-like protein
MKKLTGKQVRVKLNDGDNYVGTFVCMDGCLNVVLEDVVCFGESGQVDPDDMENNSFSECFIRGNNLCYITPV